MEIRRTGFEPGQIALRETLFHTANGYLGVRASPEEGAPPGARSIRGTYVNAFYDTGEIAYGEKLYGFATQRQTMVNLPDAQGVRVWLEGELFDPARGECPEYAQVLNMEEGVYTRFARWRSPAGRETLLTFERLVSFAQRELFLLRVTVTPVNWTGGIKLLSTLEGEVYNDYDPADPRKLAERARMLLCERVWAENGALRMRCRTAHSGMTLACAVGHAVSPHMPGDIACRGEGGEAAFTGEARAGQSVCLTKYCVYADSRRHERPDEDARVILNACQALDFDAWRARQRAYLNDFWRDAEMSVQGDAQLNESLHYCAYSLLQSCGGDAVSNIPSKGLSGEGYEGHYFWDTEIYMFPFFLLTAPGRARALLDYRASILDSAMEQARLLGHARGALYAWRTIGGAECSGYYPSGSAQYHINADIAHAFLDYWKATDDLDYMARTGARVLIETARLWLDVGHYGRDGRFRIDCVTGPDEYSCLVNNNFYTNRAAQEHLRGVVLLCRALEEAGRMDAVRACTGITREELADFARAADGMLLPFDKALGIRAQDDAFLQKEKIALSSIPRDNFPLLTHYHPLWLYRRQVCKQADAVLAHFLYEEGEDEEVIRRTYDYYEKITTHDSSLSECVFSMMAARVGDTQKAYDYYVRSACLDLADTHRNTRDGIHAANMGGAWMGIAYGFGGLRLTRDGLLLRPCLPPQWQGYAFQVRFRGARIQVSVTRAGVALRLLSGEALQIELYGEKRALADTLLIPLREKFVFLPRA